MSEVLFYTAFVLRKYSMCGIARWGASLIQGYQAGFWRREMRGSDVVKIASEIVRLSQEQVDLLETVPINRWTETQQDGYRLRRERISELSTEISDSDPNATRPK